MPTIEIQLVFFSLKFYNFFKIIFFFLVPNDRIKTTLELIQATHELTITDQWIEPLIAKPMFRALHFQSNLESINLSNNFIEDEGCKYLAEALPTLDKLKVLNLSGNYITWQGISVISSKLTGKSVSGGQSVLQLETLKLNYNPLTNQAIPYITNLVAHLKQLKSLHLCSTHLTELGTISLAGITDLDISFNHFKIVEMRKMLKQLNACKVIRFNVAFCVSEPGMGETLATFLQGGTLSHMTDLNLSGLLLDDGDLFEIVQTLRRAKLLKHLYLIGIEQITGIGLMHMLQHLCVDHLHLDGCTNILNGIDTMHSINAINCNQLTITSACENNIKKFENIWHRIHTNGTSTRHRRIITFGLLDNNDDGS